ncbi:hypothetical protein NDU88_004464 [Pleurodeles waltl]|uniref:Uncharacterized protein n=1 Tax=Pleurodeles waltl TaxID=8319 RepID=A0AAV7QIE3_PLEWA|nr:hypothetical protein NDU88_004464 [Pleurodeles waltl]
MLTWLPRHPLVTPGPAEPNMSERVDALTGETWPSSAVIRRCLCWVLYPTAEAGTPRRQLVKPYLQPRGPGRPQAPICRRGRGRSNQASGAQPRKPVRRDLGPAGRSRVQKAFSRYPCGRYPPYSRCDYSALPCGVSGPPSALPAEQRSTGRRSASSLDRWSWRGCSAASGAALLRALSHWKHTGAALGWEALLAHKRAAALPSGLEQEVNARGVKLCVQDTTAEVEGDTAGECGREGASPVSAHPPLVPPPHTRGSAPCPLRQSISVPAWTRLSWTTMDG